MFDGLCLLFIHSWNSLWFLLLGNMVHFFEQITCWEYIFMGFVVIDGFLAWTSNQQNTRLLRYKKEPPRFEPHLCQQLCRLCVTWWGFCTPKKGGDFRRVTFEVGSCFFFWGWFPPPSLWRYCTNNSSQPETGRLGQKWHLSGTSRRRVTIPSSRPMKISNSAGYIVWSVISLSS